MTVDAGPEHRWILAILSFISTCLAAAAAGILFHELRLTWSGRCAKGTVVGLEERRTGFDSASNFHPDFPRTSVSTAWYPQVEFLAGERTVRFRSTAGSDSPRYRVGDKVRVLYPPDDPEHATIDTFANRWLVVAALVLFSAGFGGFAWFLSRV